MFSKLDGSLPASSFWVIPPNSRNSLTNSICSLQCRAPLARPSRPPRPAGSHTDWQKAVNGHRGLDRKTAGQNRRGTAGVAQARGFSGANTCTRIAFMTHLSSELCEGRGTPPAALTPPSPVSTARRRRGTDPAPGSAAAGPALFRLITRSFLGASSFSCAASRRLGRWGCRGTLWPGPSVSNSYRHQWASAVCGRPAYGGGIVVVTSGAGDAGAPLAQVGPSA